MRAATRKGQDAVAADLREQPRSDGEAERQHGRIDAEHQAALWPRCGGGKYQKKSDSTKSTVIANAARAAAEPHPEGAWPHRSPRNATGGGANIASIVAANAASGWRARCEGAAMMEATPAKAVLRPIMLAEWPRPSRTMLKQRHAEPERHADRR